MGIFDKFLKRKPPEEKPSPVEEQPWIPKKIPKDETPTPPPAPPREKVPTEVSIENGEDKDKTD